MSLTQQEQFLREEVEKLRHKLYCEVNGEPDRLSNVKAFSLSTALDDVIVEYLKVHRNNKLNKK
ncbi:MAG: hypothetical protein WD907_06815 [Bacilli bacterium]